MVIINLMRKLRYTTFKINEKGTMSYKRGFIDPIKLINCFKVIT